MWSLWLLTYGTESKSSPLCISVPGASQRQQAGDKVGSFVKILLHDLKFKLHRHSVGMKAKLQMCCVKYAIFFSDDFKV